MSRVALSGLFVYFIFQQDTWAKTAALIVFSLAAITDYWDGYFARKHGLITLFGKLADPIADKVLTLSAFVSFAMLGLVSYIWVAIIASREIYVTVVRLAFPDHMPVAAQKSGKNKTFVQMSYIIFGLSYLAFSEAGWLQPSWFRTIEQVIRYGIIPVVLMTLWSGIRLAIKQKPARVA
jgi:CDP-diacylglycerol--glycerol-3-phosphate 3-phosphatidyltransferase